MTYPEKFRVWVQTALPLVFDDSLSYYELLAKVVNYINDIIKDIKAVNEKIDALDIETVVETVGNMQEIIDKLPVDEVEGLVDDVDDLKNSVNTLNEEYAILQATLAEKANTSDVNTALAEKANTSDVNTALAEKANTSDVNTALAEKAPKRHSSINDGYGVGNDTLYGHLKLSDSIESDNSVGSGVAATPLSVNIVNNKVKSYSKKNLIDNAYFVGGVFPVNQRGQTLYQNTDEFIIDRWKLVSGNVRLTAAGLLLNGTISQKIEETVTQAVTASVLTDSGMETAVFDAQTGTFSITGSDITVIAAKLELGSYQTLAHNEGTDESPVWVLNEIPDWGEELRKCQRFLQWIPASGSSQRPVGFGLVWNDTNVRINVPLPVPMNKTPAVTTKNCSVRIYQVGTSSSIEPSDISAATSSYSNAIYRGYVSLNCTITGGTNAALAVMLIAGTGNPGGILLSAED